MKILTVNAKTYEISELTFGLLCKLEDRGFTITDLVKKPFSFTRAYISAATSLPTKKVEEELDEHMKNGYSFEDIVEVIAECIDESGFFQEAEVKNEKKQSKKVSKSNA